ncbi:MAG: class I SAM-dependent methyltransferase [Saprospiraceae bacterium]
MLTKLEKRALRADLFRYMDGLGTGPSAHLLHEKGVLNYLLEKGQASLSELTEKFAANEGYLNVALRILTAQGWLEMDLDNEKDEVQYRTNEQSAAAFAHCWLYEDLVKLMKLSGQYHPRLFKQEPFQFLKQIFEKFKQQYGISFSEDATTKTVQKQILKHLEGMICAPSIVALGMSGMFHKYFMEASFRAEEFHQDAQSFSVMLDFFSHLGWFQLKNGTYRFTEKGLFFAKRASAFGVTVSYSATFRNLDELIFGNPMLLWEKPENAKELHVDRKMNVWGSGGAHGTYFKKVDEIIISIFNQPIEDQPKGIVDMGCGNGAYLQHLYEVIEQRTLRGTMLEDYPLFLVGADYNEAALKVTRANLIKADIWAKVIWGDIGRPDLLAADLLENYGIELKDLLNVRTFLDHNRIWETPSEQTPNRVSQSTGAFAFRGKRISNQAVEDNLLLHLKKWSPYVEKFGLLVIELHTIPPNLTAKNLGRTAATAYDATHGYSDQYIVEIEVFNKIAAEAGLYPTEEYFTRFPNSEIATVSINLLKGKN